MPARPVFTGSFATADTNAEVICPLRNQDASHCRKRCLGEKRYRSMQEHIRRAHPEYYIPKLPATEESFQLMITSTPSEKPPPLPTSIPPTSYLQADRKLHKLQGDHRHEMSLPRISQKSYEDQFPTAANAAVALAQLHTHRPDSDWDSDADDLPGLRRMKQSIELPSIQDHIRDQQLNAYHLQHPRELLPSVMSRSPERSSTLPPIQRRESFGKRDRVNRPRKSSITQNRRRPKHEKSRSRDHARRLSFEGRRQAYSAEPPIMNAAAAVAQGKRWEELIEAAASATEADSDRDMTPIPISPSTAALKRASMPPYTNGFHQSSQRYKASPLARPLTPPPSHSIGRPSPHPSIENPPGDPIRMLRSPSQSISHSAHTSTASGQNFHMPPTGLQSDTPNSSPPTFYSHPHERKIFPQTHSHAGPVPNTNTLHPPHSDSSLTNGFRHSTGAISHLLNTSSPSTNTNVNTPFTSPPLPMPPGKDKCVGTGQLPLSAIAAVSIYCAGCQRTSALKDSYACTECISGFCSECVYMLTSPTASHSGAHFHDAATVVDGSSPGSASAVVLASTAGSGTNAVSGRTCPKCGTRGGSYKSFQVDLVGGSVKESETKMTG